MSPVTKKITFPKHEYQWVLEKLESEFGDLLFASKHFGHSLGVVVQNKNKDAKYKSIGLDLRRLICNHFEGFVSCEDMPHSIFDLNDQEDRQKTLDDFITSTKEMFERA